MIYRDVKYSIWNDKFIKFVNLNAKNSFNMRDPFPNDEGYLSIPKAYMNSPQTFAMVIIDRTYEWAEYAKKHEFHGLAYAYISR